MATASWRFAQLRVARALLQAERMSERVPTARRLDSFDLVPGDLSCIASSLPPLI